MTREVWLVGPDGTRVADRLTEPVGSTGAQGSVWRLSNRPDTVVKVMHRTDPDRLATRVGAMLAAPGGWAGRGGHPAVAWPTAAVHRRPDGRLVGYAAPRLSLPHAVHLPLALNPAVRARILPGGTWAWWFSVAEDLARTLHTVHERNHVVGDLAPANLFVTAPGGAALIDADGWQLRDPRTGADLPCPSSRPEYTAPEVLDDPLGPREPASDIWALAVVTVQMLFLGFHPFGGIPPHASTGVEELDNVRAGRCWLLGADLRVPAAAPPAWLLPPLLLRRLRETLDAARDDPAARPTALDWAAALAHSRRTLVPCRRRPGHVHAPDAPECPWCAMVAAGVRDPFPVPTPTAGAR